MTQISRETERDDTGTGNKKRSRVGIVFYLLVSLVFISLLSWAVYVFYQQILKDRLPGGTPEHIRLERLEAQFQANSATIATLQEMLNQYRDDQVSADQALEEFRQQTMIGMADIRDNLGTSSQDWLYAEVEYLIRMANQRVLMEGDTASALTLLQTAHKIIAPAEGLTAHELRQALVKDIATLKAVASPDLEGLYLELSAQIGQVSKLPQKIPGVEPKPPAQAPEDSPQTMSQRAFALVVAMGNRIMDLVDFRKGGAPVAPVLLPSEEYYLRHNLILKFQIAQMALLEKNQEVYQTSLAEAQDWVLTYFDPDDAVTRAMQTSLIQLHQARVGGKVPDISNSLREVRSLLAKFHQAGSR